MLQKVNEAKYPNHNDKELLEPKNSKSKKTKLSAIDSAIALQTLPIGNTS